MTNASLLASIDPADVLVLMPCGGKKLDREAPAIELYTRGLWDVLRKHLGAIGREQVCVLSGKYGFINALTWLEPYEARLSAQRADQLIARGVHAAFDGKRTGMTPICHVGASSARMRRPYAAVLIAGAGDYRRVLEAYVAGFIEAGVVAAAAIVCQVEGGIGEQRSQLGQWLDAINGAAELEAETLEIERQVEQLPVAVEAPIAPAAELEVEAPAELPAEISAQVEAIKWAAHRAAKAELSALGRSHRFGWRNSAAGKRAFDKLEAAALARRQPAIDRLVAKAQRRQAHDAARLAAAAKRELRALERQAERQAEQAAIESSPAIGHNGGPPLEDVPRVLALKAACIVADASPAFACRPAVSLTGGRLKLARRGLRGDPRPAPIEEELTQ